MRSSTSREVHHRQLHVENGRREWYANPDQRLQDSIAALLSRQSIPLPLPSDFEDRPVTTPIKFKCSRDPYLLASPIRRHNSHSPPSRSSSRLSLPPLTPKNKSRAPEALPSPMCSPPTGGASSVHSNNTGDANSPDSHGPTEGESVDTEGSAHTHDRVKDDDENDDESRRCLIPSPPKVRGLPSRELHPPASHRQGEDHSTTRLTELTLTYVTILQKSEDFNRRAVKKDESKKRDRLKALMDEFQRIIPMLLGEFYGLLSAETAERSANEREWLDGITKLGAAEASGFAMARRREGSRPKCHILQQGKRSLLTETAVDRCFVELSWRGGVDLNLIAVALDDKNGLFGFATNGEGLRIKGRLMIVRPMNDYDGNCGSGIGGSRMTFQLSLSSCPVNVSRIAFCVAPRGFSENLGDLKQCWLTVSELPIGLTTVKQLFTIFVPSLTFRGAVLVASLKRRPDRASLWQYVNDGSDFLGHLKPPLVSSLTAEFYRTLAEQRFDAFCAAEAAYCNISLRLIEAEQRAAIEHEALMDEETAAWRSLLQHDSDTRKKSSRKGLLRIAATLPSIARLSQSFHDSVNHNK